MKREMLREMGYHNEVPAVGVEANEWIEWRGFSRGESRRLQPDYRFALLMQAAASQASVVHTVYFENSDSNLPCNIDTARKSK